MASLYPDPLDSILGSIKSLNNGAELGKDEYIFGASTAIPLEGNTINTSLHIQSKSVQSPFAGEVTVKHTRLDLADLLVLVSADVSANNIGTTVDFALALNKVYGTNFTADDIESTPVTLTDGSGNVTLVAKATSRGWIGSVTFRLTKGRIQLSEVITTTRLDGLDYPDPYVGKPFGNAYAYWRDFSAQSGLLDVIIPANPDLGSIKDALVAITGDTWVTAGTVRYSLEGATVLYVGEAVGYPELNQKYGKAVVVQLGTACLGLSGRMFLHYNLPTPG